MRSGVGDRPALAAEPSADCNGNEMNLGTRLSGNGPDERNRPADGRPSEEQVEQKDARSIAFVSANDCG